MKIYVGARNYEIHSLDDCSFNEMLPFGTSLDVLAFIDYDAQEIFVRERLKQEHRSELVLHELLHASFEDAGIEQNSETENFIKIISPRLNALISQNDLLNVLKKV